MDDENKEWFAIVADKDVYNDRGKLEYAKGSVVSYGTEIAEKAVLTTKGLRPVSIGLNPDFTNNIWNPEIEKMEPRSQETQDAS